LETLNISVYVSCTVSSYMGGSRLKYGYIYTVLYLYTFTFL